MVGLNNAFYFVTTKIIEIQGYFIGIAWGIGRVVLLIALLSMAFNYALTGQGLKENVIKLLKATLFFIIVMGAYPRIINWITVWTYNTAYNTVGGKLVGEINSLTNKARTRAAQLKSQALAKALDNANALAAANPDATAATTVTTVTVTGGYTYARPTFGSVVLSDEQKAAAAAREYARSMNASAPSANFFGGIIGEVKNERTGQTFRCIAPAAALQSMLMVAGECIRAANDAPPKKGFIDTPDFGMLIAGYLCAFFVMFAGCFAMLEYFIAFLEFMFISSVGVILFPCSLWEGSKFLTEKFISAIIGFTIKLLFCTLCIFLMLWGYLSLAVGFVSNPFTGLADQIIMIVFTCLLFFYICKSAPGLAQSLLTGSPSLSAAGAIGAVTSAVGAVAAVGGAARAVGGAAAHGAVNMAGYAAQAKGASDAAGGGLKGLAAGAKSVGGSIAQSAGSGLTRSLMAHSPFMPSGGGAGGGVNRFSPAQMLMKANDNGTQKTTGEFFREQYATGAGSVNSKPKPKAKEPEESFHQKLYGKDYYKPGYGY